MPAYNEKFDLTIEDMELIETALQQQAETLSNQSLKDDEECSAKESLLKIHELLGRLHNQKVFYYPKNKAYIGG